MGVWDIVDKQVNEYVKKNVKNNQQIKDALYLSVEKEVEILMNCMLKYTDSRTVKDSIIIKNGNSPDEKIITFDPQKAYLRSEFNDPTSEVYQGGGYKSDFYAPIARNEGYQLKVHTDKPRPYRWINYFGRGSSGFAEHFIELGIKDYESKNKGKLKIKVEKVFDIKYSNYNDIINTTSYYGDFDY